MNDNNPKATRNAAFAAAWQPILDLLEKGPTQIARELTQSGSRIDQRQVSEWKNPGGYKCKDMIGLTTYLRAHPAVPEPLIQNLIAVTKKGLTPMDKPTNVAQIDFSSTRSKLAAEPERTAVPPGPRDLPIRKVRRDLSTGGVILLSQTVDHSERPPNLLKNADAYSFRQVGDEMEPRHRQGELLQIVPDTLDPQRIKDDTIILYLTADGGDREIYVCTFLSESRDGITVSTIKHPTPEFHTWSEVFEVHLVTGSLYRTR